ncbi:MAG: hypothetical protein WD883_01390 [Candidatus Colwellbacteria bacterium]
MKSKSTLPRDVFSKFDIRGTYPDKITKELVTTVAQTLATKVFKKGRVAIGHDARVSSPELYQAAKSALEAIPEIEVVEIGLASTPMMTFAVNHLEASGGFMITASHNPKEYNGIKAMGQGGEPISGEDIYKLLE